MLLTLIVVGLTLILLSSLAVMACMFSAQLTCGEEAESRLTHVATSARRAKAARPRLTTET
jgi:hypothetical protein